MKPQTWAENPHGYWQSGLRQVCAGHCAPPQQTACTAPEGRQVCGSADTRKGNARRPELESDVVCGREKVVDLLSPATNSVCLGAEGGLLTSGRRFWSAPADPCAHSWRQEQRELHEVHHVHPNADLLPDGLDKGQATTEEHERPRPPLPKHDDRGKPRKPYHDHSHCRPWMLVPHLGIAGSEVVGDQPENKHGIGDDAARHPTKHVLNDTASARGGRKREWPRGSCAATIPPARRGVGCVFVARPECACRRPAIGGVR